MSARETKYTAGVVTARKLSAKRRTRNTIAYFFTTGSGSRIVVALALLQLFNMISLVENRPPFRFKAILPVLVLPLVNRHVISFRVAQSCQEISKRKNQTQVVGCVIV